LSPEKWRQLELLKVAAASSQKGSTHFFEIDSCPVCSVLLVTGDKKNNGTNEMDIHLRFINQPDHYPKVMKNRWEVQKAAYNDYVSKKLHQLAADQSKGILIKKYVDYARDYQSEIQIFDKVVKENHGVRCFENSDLNNDTYGNVIFLHICDVINIYANKLKGVKTDLFLKLELLSELQEDMSDLLFEKFLKG
jgi:hypothetical protein